MPAERCAALWAIPRSLRPAAISAHELGRAGRRGRLPAYLPRPSPHSLGDHVPTNVSLARFKACRLWPSSELRSRLRIGSLAFGDQVRSLHSLAIIGAALDLGSVTSEMVISPSSQWVVPARWSGRARTSLSRRHFGLGFDPPRFFAPTLGSTSPLHLRYGRFPLLVALC